MTNLSDAANIATLVQTAWPLLTLIGVAGVGGGISGGAAYIKIFRKKERQLLANLKRKVAIIPARQGSMDHETRLIDQVGFFKTDALAADGRSADMITNEHRLVVLQYDSDESSHFWANYANLQSKQMPVIVYAKPDEIPRDRDDMKRIQQYSLHTLCNTPLRLLSDVTSIMSTYPEKK